MTINATSIYVPESLVAPRISETSSDVFESKENLSKREEVENLSVADRVLEGVRDKLLNFQANNGETFNSIVSTGGKLTTGANISATFGEPAGAKQFSPVSKYSTKLNLFFTGLKGAFDGLVQTKDIIYSIGKATDALVGILPIPQELQFGLRVGPSLSNFATAIRQEAGITQYEKFTDAFKLASKKIGEYFNNVKEIGYLNTFERDNAEKALTFSVGAPIQAFMGSLTAIASYLPFIPKPISNALKTAGYLNRFAGAAGIDLYELTAKTGKSQYSGTAKINFLGGAISDLVNKGAHVAKTVGQENINLKEDSLIIKGLDVLEKFTKNLTPTLESLGRVNNEKAIENGVNNERFQVVGMKGILNRYIPSVLESMFGIPAKGNSDEEIQALKEREAMLRGETFPTGDEFKALSENLAKEEPEAKNEIKPVKVKTRVSSSYDDSIYDYESSSASAPPVKKLSVRASVVEKDGNKGERQSKTKNIHLRSSQNIIEKWQHKIEKSPYRERWQKVINKANARKPQPDRIEPVNQNDENHVNLEASREDQLNTEKEENIISTKENPKKGSVLSEVK